MDSEKLRVRVREALGGAGITGDIADMVDRLIEEEVGGDKKSEAPQPAKVAAPSKAAWDDDEEDEEEEEDKPAPKPAAARKTAVPHKRR